MGSSASVQWLVIGSVAAVMPDGACLSFVEVQRSWRASIN